MHSTRWKVVLVAIVVGTVAALLAPAEVGAQRPPIGDLRPLTEPGFYVVESGRYPRGLYPAGRNEMPAAHRQAGQRIAGTIVPLNALGRPDPNGQIVVAVAGHSNTRRYFNGFSQHVAEQIAAGRVNPRVVISNSAVSSKLCQDWLRDPAMDRSAEVQVLLLLTTYHSTNRSATQQRQPEVMSMPFEQKMRKMKDDLRSILEVMTRQCPNLKIAYVGSDTWRGYSRMEPQVYEEAFAVKWLIEDQLRGDAELAFEGAKRKVPWLAWGGYIWEASPPRERFVGDGVHPSAQGEAFVTERWFEALSADAAARGWFLSPAGAAR